MNPTIGKETHIEVGGRRYQLARFDRRIYDQFISWADRKLGHPLDGIKDRLKDFPPKIQEIMVKDALDRAALRRSINSPEVQSLLATPEGCMKILALLLQKHQPDLTDDQAEALYEACNLEYGEGYLIGKLEAAQGRIPQSASDAERAALEGIGAFALKKKLDPPQPIDWLTVDKILVLKFHFLPWQLEALTVPECFGLYVQAVIDEAKAHEPKDETLMPHLASERAAEQEKALAQVAAYNKLSPAEKLDLGYRLYDPPG